MMGFKQIPVTSVDGVPTFKDSELKQLFREMQDQGITKRLFYDGTVKTEEDFVKFVKSPDVMPWFTISDDGMPLMFWWLSNITKTSAFAHFAAFRIIWGDGIPVYYLSNAMSVCFDLLKFETIAGCTPASYRLALKTIESVGANIVGTIPAFQWNGYKNHPVDCVISQIRKEDLK